MAEGLKERSPSVPRSVMTSQSTASVKVPKRKFKAKPGRAPLKTPGPEVLLDACLNERTGFVKQADGWTRVCLVMHRCACMIQIRQCLI